MPALLSMTSANVGPSISLHHHKTQMGNALHALPTILNAGRLLDNSVHLLAMHIGLALSLQHSRKTTQAVECGCFSVKFEARLFVIRQGLLDSIRVKSVLRLPPAPAEAGPVRHAPSNEDEISS